MDLGWVRRLNGRLSPAQCRNLTARIGIAVQLSGTLPINSFHLALPPGMVKSTTDDGWWSARPSNQSLLCSVKQWTFNVNWSVRCRFQSHQSLSIMLSTLAHVHSHSITLPPSCYRSFPTNNQLHSYLTNIWKIEFKMEFPKWNIWFLKFSKSWNRIPEQKKFITLVPSGIKGSYLVYG